MTTLSSLVALKVIILTTCSATSTDKVGIMTTLSFQWINSECSWWLHDMEALSVLLVLCNRNPLDIGVPPHKRPVMWSFDIYFALILNSKSYYSIIMKIFVMTGCPAVREKSGKFQTWQKSGKSQGILLKVREKMNIGKKSGKSQGICI